MKHLILLFFIISFATGIGTTIIGNLAYMKHKLPVIKQILLAECYFTGLLVFDIINYYVEINYISTKPSFYMIILLGLLSAGIGVIYHFTYFVHLLINKPFERNKRITFCCFSLIALILLVGLNMAAVRFKDFFEYPSSFLLHNLFTGLGAFYNLIMLYKNRGKLNSYVKKAINYGMIVLILLVPFSIFMNTLEFYIIFSQPLPFSPIIYFLVNIIGVIFTRKMLIEGNPEPSRKDKDDALIKEFLTQFDITNRELEVVKYVMEGYGNQEIGEKLFISPNTVKNHIYNIYKKMGINNRYELISKISQVYDLRG